MDALRDELNNKLDAIRADMLALLRADADLTTQTQHRVILIAAVLTVLAAVLGLVFAPWSAPASPVRSGGCWKAPRRSRPAISMACAGHLAGRNRPSDDRVQSDGRAVAPQGARCARPLANMSIRASSKD